VKIPTSKHRPWDKIKTSAPPIASRTRDEFYHTSRWTKESRAFRQANPLCMQCKREGIIAPSEVTDHIIPKNICKDPWDRNNWEALCKRHNLAKGAQDKKHFKK
jgi:5-methylcytosine-specific restriction endonuclease McrA